MGWAYWQYKTFKDPTTSAGDRSEGFYNPDGSLQPKVKQLARTYVPYTQGTLQSESFNSGSGAFHAAFIFDATINAPTEIHVF